MLILVIVCNLLITLVNLYVAWRIWKLRRGLARVANTLIDFERSTHAVLHPAPELISQGQKGTHNLKKRYQKLELQLQQVQQIITLLSLIPTIWQWQSRQGRSRGQKRRRKDSFRQGNNRYELRTLR